MQLAITVGSVVLGGIVVVALIGFLLEKYANRLDP
jgi:F0F1-type ATP synthase assembly protein I